MESRKGEESSRKREQVTGTSGLRSRTGSRNCQERGQGAAKEGEMLEMRVRIWVGPGSYLH